MTSGGQISVRFCKPSRAPPNFQVFPILQSGLPSPPSNEPNLFDSSPLTSLQALTPSRQQTMGNTSSSSARKPRPNSPPSESPPSESPPESPSSVAPAVHLAPPPANRPPAPSLIGGSRPNSPRSGEPSPRSPRHNRNVSFSHIHYDALEEKVSQ